MCYLADTDVEKTIERKQQLRLFSSQTCFKIKEEKENQHSLGFISIASGINEHIIEQLCCLYLCI